MSSGEAEFYGCVRAASRAIGMQSLCQGLGREVSLRIWSDSAAALGIMQRRGCGKVRHLETPTMWVQKALKDGRFELVKVPGKSNPADLGTKFLDQAAMLRALKMMSVELSDAPLSSWAAARRAEEAAADRAAAEAVGSIMPVAAGLVLLHGSDTDRRRLGRGELPGLLEDCRAEQAPQRRWTTWWTSVVKMKLRPPLYIRLAELADWAASEEGKARLPRNTPRRYEVSYSWLGWLLTPCRWGLERLGLRR
ncbi:unnamed protein product [Prorocentrum cordatum]|uniref:Uncharacterized protein n=1 Tax=Prorocentrum cordatum TaxID=2364126 RepID=A0ABN9XF80_9DINO|nr:unnamed protein product [Polarella glacialis]